MPEQTSLNISRGKGIILKNDFKNILVIRQSALGDVANILPILEVLRNAWPQARLTVLTGRITAPLLINDPCVDEVVTFDRTRNPLRLLPMMWQLNRRRFDLVIDFHASKCTRWLAMATQSGLRIASKGAPFYTKKISFDLKSQQVTAIFRDFLAPVGLNHVPMRPRFPGLAESRDATLDLLRRENISMSYLVFNPGHSPAWSTKSWPEAHWAELAKTALAKGFQVVFSGGPGERILATRIMDKIGVAAGVHNLAGKTTLPQLAWVMRQAAAVVSTDSGPMHVAAMGGAKVVALFGPTHPVTSAPFGTGHKVLHHKLHCSYCFKKVCPYKHECLDQMLPTEVWSAVEEILAASGGSVVHEA